MYTYLYLDVYKSTYTYIRQHCEQVGRDLHASDASQQLLHLLLRT